MAGMKTQSAKFEDRIWHIILNPEQNPKKIWVFVRGISGLRLGPFGDKGLALKAFDADRASFYEENKLARDLMIEQDEPHLGTDREKDDPIERDTNIAEQEVSEGYIMWPVTRYSGESAALLEGPEGPISITFVGTEDILEYLRNVIRLHIPLRDI